jgi:hypothetical protein
MAASVRPSALKSATATPYGLPWIGVVVSRTKPAAPRRMTSSEPPLTATAMSSVPLPSKSAAATLIGPSHRSELVERSGHGPPAVGAEDSTGSA